MNEEQAERLEAVLNNPTAMAWAEEIIKDREAIKAVKALVESWIERERGYHEKILEMRRQEKSSTIYEVWLMATQLHRWELQEAAGLPSSIDTPGLTPGCKPMTWTVGWPISEPAVRSGGAK